MKHEKLVRDKIPEIIMGSGRDCKTRVLDRDEYVKELEKKLSEEVEEYLSDKTAEELCDILEVVYALAKVRGVSFDGLEELRRKKADERGAFDKKIYLIEAD